MLKVPLRFILVGLLCLCTLSCQQEQPEPKYSPLPENLDEPLKENLRLPLDLTFSVDAEGNEGFRYVTLKGTPTDAPEFAPEFDWSNSTWGTDEGKPLVLVAISNARTPRPLGGVHEQFLIIDDRKCVVEMQGKRPPRLRIYGDITLAAGTTLLDYQISAMVLDRRYRRCVSRFVETGVIDLDLDTEYHSITPQMTEAEYAQVHHNLIYGLQPVDLRRYVDREVAHVDKMILRFKPLSTVFVFELADPNYNHQHARLETELFTTRATLSMSAKEMTGNNKLYKMSNAQPINHTFRDVFAGATQPSERYRRVITMWLTNPDYPWKEEPAITAQYMIDGQAENPKSRGESGVISAGEENESQFSGRIFFLDLAVGANTPYQLYPEPITPPHRDDAKYFKTRWTSGNDGYIGFFVAPLYSAGYSVKPNIAETHRAKIYYRKVGSNEWYTYDLGGPREGWVPVIMRQLDSNTEYDIWMENLSGFIAGFGEPGADILYTITPENLLQVSQWGTSNEWGKNLDRSAIQELFWGKYRPQISQSEVGLLFADTRRLSLVSTQDIPNLRTLSTLERMFFNSNVSTISRIADWDVSNVKSLRHMFAHTKNFNSNLSNWDVSSVIEMYGLFAFAEAFNGDVSRWDVSRVKSMNYMFWGAKSFNQDISRWNVSNVEVMAGMFERAHNFNADISRWDVGKVRDMRSMFAGASNFSQDLSTWNVGNVTNMWEMFRDAHRFNADLSRWNVSRSTNVGAMFNNARAFNQNLGTWALSGLETLQTPRRDLEPVPVFDGSGMSVVNIEATFAGWRAFAEANPTAMRNMVWAVTDNSIARFENPAMVSLRWFRDNRGWTQKQVP